MSATTRIHASDHERLQRLARETGQTHQQVLSRALEQFEREVLLQAMNDGFEALRADTAAWAEEEHERSLWDRTNTDTGIDG